MCHLRVDLMGTGIAYMKVQWPQNVAFKCRFNCLWCSMYDSLMATKCAIQVLIKWPQV